MTIKIILFIKGVQFQENVIELPLPEQLHDDYEKNFYLNCERRIQFVNHTIADMQLLYLRAIVANKFDYDFMIVAQSKMNVMQEQEEINF